MSSTFLPPSAFHTQGWLARDGSPLSSLPSDDHEAIHGSGEQLEKQEPTHQLRPRKLVLKTPPGSFTSAHLRRVVTGRKERFQAKPVILPAQPGAKLEPVILPKPYPNFNGWPVKKRIPKHKCNWVNCTNCLYWYHSSCGDTGQ